MYNLNFTGKVKKIYCKGKIPYNYKDKFYYNSLQIYVTIIMWTAKLVHKKFSKIQRATILWFKRGGLFNKRLKQKAGLLLMSHACNSNCKGVI